MSGRRHVPTAGCFQARHITKGQGAWVIRDPAGADTVVCARVAAPAAAAAGSSVIQLWVDVLRAAWHTDGSVHQRERHTAALDQETPPKASLQIGVLEKEKQSCREVVQWLNETTDFCIYLFLHEMGCGNNLISSQSQSALLAKFVYKYFVSKAKHKHLTI